MDFDSFLSTPRWEILQILAERPSSPIEIAEKLNTTVSYSSQQLTLLSAAGIVSKKRTGAFEKGKPRNLFSINNELAYLSILTNGFSDKKLLNLNQEHKAIIRLWIYYPVCLHNLLQRLFWSINSQFEEGYRLFIDKQNKELLLVSDVRQIREKFEEVLRSNKKEFKEDFKSRSLSLDAFSKIKSESLELIYSRVNELKGGIDKNK